MSTVRRVRVAAFAGGELAPGIALARRLAQGFGGGFAATLVEEAALADLAALPIGAEIGRVSRRARAAGPETMLAEIRRSLAAARRALSLLSAELGAVPPDAPVPADPADAIRAGVAPDEILLCIAPPWRLAEPVLAAALLEAAGRAAGVAIAGGPGRRGPTLVFTGSAGASARAGAVLARIGAPAPDAIAAEGVSGRSAAAIAAGRRAALVAVEAGVGPAATAADLAALVLGAGCPALILNLDRL